MWPAPRFLDDDEGKESDAARSSCAREMAHMNCSNSTAAHESGVSAGVAGGATSTGDQGSADADPPLRSADLTASGETEPDWMYLQGAGGTLRRVSRETGPHKQ